jgi:hypothetical protein
MSLIAKHGGNFIPAPEGLHRAVCVDVVDLGMVDGQWGKKRKCRIMWEIDSKMDDGKRFVVGKQYTLSLHEKSGLHKDLKAWRGVAFTPDELKGFDVEKVIGAPCQLLIGHTEKDGSVYANISAITKADPKAKLTPSGTYIRAKNREGAAAVIEEEPETDSDTETVEEPCPF